MSEFNEIRNRIEREVEKKYPGYRGPRWGAWTPGRPSLLDNPRCTCNGTFDHAAGEWRHHAKCPVCGDDRPFEDCSVEVTVPEVGQVKLMGKGPVE